MALYRTVLLRRPVACLTESSRDREIQLMGMNDIILGPIKDRFQFAAGHYGLAAARQQGSKSELFSVQPDVGQYSLKT